MFMRYIPTTIIRLAFLSAELTIMRNPPMNVLRFNPFFHSHLAPLILKKRLSPPSPRGNICSISPKRLYPIPRLIPQR